MTEEWGNPLFTFCIRTILHTTRELVNLRCSIDRRQHKQTRSNPSIEEHAEADYLEENGFELVDIEYVKEGSNWFLRVFVDKEGGIDIDDCGRISEYLSESG